MTSPGGAAAPVVVVGAGVAGMAAAVALESAGVPVTLLEARRSLGGRAASHADPHTGEQLDNCQHVLLGCCTNLLDFYRRIGCLDKIRFEPAIRFVDARGRSYSLSSTPGLPAPLNFALAGLKFNALTWRERTELARASLAMMRTGRLGRANLADVPFGKWLDDHGQSAGLVKNLYIPVLLGALNEDVRLASTTFALQVFQDALLANSAGWALGVSTVPLSDLYAALPCRDIRFGARVSRLEVEGGRVTGVRLVTGEMLRAPTVVLATNHHTLAKWVPPEWIERDARFHHLDKIESVPILGVQLWFDRPVLPESHAALLDGPLQWLFRADAEGRVIKGVISAARGWAERPRDEVLAEFARQITTTLPNASAAKLLRGHVVIEKRATFAAVPGVDRLRPTQAPPPGGLPGLYLAGDYTLTGWPATMEGAVRAGYLAADAITATATVKPFLVPDLPVQWPGRLLGLHR